VPVVRFELKPALGRDLLRHARAWRLRGVSFGVDIDVVAAMVTRPGGNFGSEVAAQSRL
jgi:hypothetical protein